VLLLTESHWRHCDNGLLLVIAANDVAERQSGPAVIQFLTIDML